MNDSELKSMLKSAPVPERSEEYWNDFPSSVRVQLRRDRREATSSSAKTQNAWRPRLSWAGGFAFGVVLTLLCVQYHPLQKASAAITRHEHQLHAQVAQIETNLHLLMFNPHGMGYLLAEAN